MNMWKQPIPVNIEGLTRRELTVFQHILLRCANKTQTVKVGDQEIVLQRGQCVFGRYEFAEELLLNRSQALRVERVLSTLVKSNTLLNRYQHKHCSIITVINYDEIIKLEHLNEQIVNTNKSDKINTNTKKVKKLPVEKKTKILTLLEIKEILFSKETFQYLTDLFGNAFSILDLKLMYAWIKERDGTNNMSGRSNPKSFARNWIKRNVDSAKAKGITLAGSETDDERKKRIRAEIDKFHGFTDETTSDVE